MLNFTRYYLILCGAKVRFFSYIPNKISSTLEESFKNDEIIFVDFTSFNILISIHSPFTSLSFLSIQYFDVNHVNK